MCGLNMLYFGLNSPTLCAYLMLMTMHLELQHFTSFNYFQTLTIDNIWFLRSFPPKSAYNYCHVVVYLNPLLPIS